MTNMEKITFEMPVELTTCKVEEDTDAAGYFEGKAITFGTPIERWFGAMTFIPEEGDKDPFCLGKSVEHVKILTGHQYPIGKAVDLECKEKYLYLRARVSDTDKGREAMRLIKDGVADSLSVGMNILKDEHDKELKNPKHKRIAKQVGEDSLRIVRRAKLMEVSVVLWGADKKAKIKMDSERDRFDDACRKLETILDKFMKWSERMSLDIPAERSHDVTPASITEADEKLKRLSAILEGKNA